MSDTIDQTQLSGNVQRPGREMRRLRAQYDHLAGLVSSRLSEVDAQLVTMAASLRRSNPSAN